MSQLQPTYCLSRIVNVSKAKVRRLNEVQVLEHIIQ